MTTQSKSKAFTGGNDKQDGTSAAELLNGLGGNDTIFGFAGDDTLNGSTGNDFLNGGVGNDSLIGGAGNDSLLGDVGHDNLDGDTGNDTLQGDAGDDTLSGEVGSDSMTGGTGNDVYVVDNVGDKVVEDLSNAGGKDIVQSSITFSLADKAGVENLTLTGIKSINGTGNAANNQLTGNTGNNTLTGNAGIDTLNGGLGDDTLDGGSGADKLIGGDGSDTYILSSTEDTITEIAKDGDQDNIQTAISFTLPDNIEVLTLTGTLDINGEGNNGDNRLEGNDGANSLTGGDGDDGLDGNVGDDTLDGGTGNNILDGGDGNDTAVFAGVQSDYKLSEDSTDGTISVEDIDNGDVSELHNVETISFADGTLDISNGLAQQLSLSVSDVSQTEGDSGNKNAVFTLTLSDAASAPLSIAYSTIDGDAIAGQDYLASTGTVMFAAGETSKSVSIAVIGDTQVEDDEQFFLQLTPPDNLSLDNSEASATLLNDDLPLIGVAGATLLEGNSGKTNASVVVSLSAASKQAVTVNYATVNGTAKSGNDYMATTGTLTFAAGETKKTINVPVIGDTLQEGDETFRMLFSKSSNAKLSSPASATVIIKDNDTLPSVTLSPDLTVKEGDSGSSDAVVTVSLSAKSTQPVSVDYYFKDYDATVQQGVDYLGTQGTLTFAAGETSKTVNIPIIGDTLVEPDETFEIYLMNAKNAVSNGDWTFVTIKNDDNPAPLPTLTLSPTTLTIKEGDSGTQNVTFTATLSAKSEQNVSVTAITSDGTAKKADGDYQYTKIGITFAAGETSKTITVPIVGDSTLESDETFSVALVSPSNATLSKDSSAVVTIQNDDPPPVVITPSVSITAAQTVTEGNSGTTNATLTVTFSAAAAQAVTVNYASTDGTATAGSDYTAATGTLTFAVGETSKTITVPVLGDTTVETDETFNIALSAPINATLGNSNAVVTIKNDDTAPNAFDGWDFALTASADNVTATISNDRLDGLAGNDFIDGNDGQDSLSGSAGNDTLWGSVGFDTLNGGDDNDSLLGGSDNDVLNGDAGDDSLDGGAGDDSLTGGDGADTLDGGTGNNTLNGGDGNDTVDSGCNANLLLGGAGDDDFTISVGSSSCTLDGGTGNDSLSVYGTHDSLILGNDGDDSLVSGNNRYSSGYSSSNNTLDGGAGNDSLSNEGSNMLLGGEGNDQLNDSYNPNSLAGGAGNDSLYGSVGNDTINGGTGIDSLSGGTEDDSFIFAAGDSGVGLGLRDIISDFYATSTVEVIDLSAVSTGVLTFNGSAAFTGADQVRYAPDFAKGITVISINLNADLAPDMEIELTGVVGLSAGDFVL